VCGRRARRANAPIRTVATTTNSLLALRDWLIGERASLVVMEATGDYWRGAFYLLEDYQVKRPRRLLRGPFPCPMGTCLGTLALLIV
jgi:transposase